MSGTRGDPAPELALPGALGADRAGCAHSTGSRGHGNQPSLGDSGRGGLPAGCRPRGEESHPGQGLAWLRGGPACTARGWGGPQGKGRAARLAETETRGKPRRPVVRGQSVLPREPLAGPRGARGTGRTGWKKRGWPPAREEQSGACGNCPEEKLGGGGVSDFEKTACEGLSEGKRKL